MASKLIKVTKVLFFNIPKRFHSSFIVFGGSSFINQNDNKVDGKQKEEKEKKNQEKEKETKQR